MNKSELFKKLKELNESVKEQLNAMQSGEKIHQIEIDILLNSIREFYEGVQTISKISTSDHRPIINEPVHTEDLIAKVEQPAVQDKENELFVEQESKNEDYNSKVLDTMSQQESLLSDINIPVNNSDQVHSEEEVILKADNISGNSRSKGKSVVSATLFDVAAEVQNEVIASTSLYDKISSAKEDKSIITRLQKNPVSDLKKSIGINEKFSFINELFDGDLNAYNEAIDKLNNSNDHTAALSFIESDLSVKYDWNNDDEALLNLKNLIARRFTV